MVTLAHRLVEVLLGREAIKAAALRFPDGKVFEGPWHLDCWTQAYAAGYIESDPFGGDVTTVDLIEHYHVDEGFTTTNGRFVDRGEAYRIAQAAGQSGFKKEDDLGFKWLDSHDVSNAYRNEGLEEYGEIITASNPAAWGCVQLSGPYGQKCRSVGWVWSKDIPQFNEYIGYRGYRFKVAFTVTDSLVPEVLSAVSPIMPSVVWGDTSYDGQTFGYIADGRGPNHKEHLVKMYRAIQQIEAKVLHRTLDTPGDYLAIMDKILAQYDNPNKI